MESVLPGDVLSAMHVDRLKNRRRRSRHLVVSGDRQHRILKLTDTGFVIEADDLPHLRGYVEIMRGEERIARRLAVFAWARDGMIGYEFKHDAAGREVPADFVAPKRTALLDAPGD